MADIRPFRALRPRPDLASRVASPPYDVLSSDEAREMAREEPLSFLHVLKPEIDLPESTDPYSPEVYARGAESFGKLIDERILIRDRKPCLYAYQQQMGDHVQVGLVAGASVAEYDSNQIRKHEHTRPVKVDDRTRHMDALDANPGPVFLTYKRQAGIDAIVDRIRTGGPEYDFTPADGIRHTLWVIEDDETVREIREKFALVDLLYVADGHHRSESASRLAAARRKANTEHTGDEPYNYFLTVLFPDDQLMILDYNRVVDDLGGLSEAAFLDKVRVSFDLLETDDPKPSQARHFGMRLGGRWYRFIARDGSYEADDPVNSLDVAILQNNLLAPILGVVDPRSDSRIDFVGGIRGMEELERRVDAGAAVAFALFPTSITELMAIADAGEVMPPKSTWFEPKLRSGLIVRPLNE